MKIIDAHTHIGNFGSWARFDFDLARLKEQMAEFDIEKTLLTGAGFHDNKSVIDAFQKEPDLIVPVAWVKPGGAAELAEIRRLVEREGFRAIKLHPLFDAYCADDTFVDPVLDLAEELTSASDAVPVKNRNSSSLQFVLRINDAILLWIFFLTVRKPESVIHKNTLPITNPTS